MENKSGKNLLSFGVDTGFHQDGQFVTAITSGTRHHDDAVDAMRYCYNDIITTTHYAHWATHGIEKVIFHDPATIVYWCDGTKTVVKCCKDDIFDPEKGLAMAICKRYLGENFKKAFKEFLPEEKKEEPREPLSTEECVKAFKASIDNLKKLSFKFKLNEKD